MKLNTLLESLSLLGELFPQGQDIVVLLGEASTSLQRDVDIVEISVVSREDFGKFQSLPAKEFGTEPYTGSDDCQTWTHCFKRGGFVLVVTGFHAGFETGADEQKWEGGRIYYLPL